MGKKLPELLAPAGNYEGFLGAVAAGADAVYLAGTKYGARAYADNFTEEEVCRAVSYAHVFGKKVYLTVNTLLKDQELEELPAYLKPYAAAGLDGVIVQDLGALLLIREAFPELPLHASTQMSLTGAAGAGMLKRMGVSRIVPARELSLAEISEIKERTGLEIETFIHGAMCYSYSGQCLFSSLLGGRSGNRGRCAQPCRLPYRIGEDGKECYPLSLKDMCTIDILPALIEAGIDSFKIEGRMKKPEYAAGVTAVYRKYLDLFAQKGKEGYSVSGEDKQILASLYIRSGIQEGYYFKQNGREMVTLTSPSYNGSDERILEEIRRLYLETPLKKEIKMQAGFTAGERAWLALQAEDQNGRIHSVRTEGILTQEAHSHPVSAENIRTALLKLGNTPFSAKAEDLELYLSGDVFYPLKALNELRRQGIRALLDSFSEKSPAFKRAEVCPKAEGTLQPALYPAEGEERERKHGVRVLVSSMEQFEALAGSGLQPDILYLEEKLADTEEKLEEIQRRRDMTGGHYRIYLALPYVTRSRELADWERKKPLFEKVDGVLARNLETCAWLWETAYLGSVSLDAGLNCFNQKTFDFWAERVESICLSYELNGRERRALLSGREPGRRKAVLEEVVYGRLPLMVTANCVALTKGDCGKEVPRKEGGLGGTLYLKDRMNKTFPVVSSCGRCFNVLYNSLPLSLHEKVAGGEMAGDIRLAFTVESKKETEAVLRFFAGLLAGERPAIPYREYTKGHEKRGVE